MVADKLNVSLAASFILGYGESTSLWLAGMKSQSECGGSWLVHTRRIARRLIRASAWTGRLYLSLVQLKVISNVGYLNEICQ